jgi:hypothetical protein
MKGLRLVTWIPLGDTIFLLESEGAGDLMIGITPSNFNGACTSIQNSNAVINRKIFVE